jgi:hypothetical protein
MCFYDSYKNRCLFPQTSLISISLSWRRVVFFEVRTEFLSIITIDSCLDINSTSFGTVSRIRTSRNAKAYSAVYMEYQKWAFILERKCRCIVSLF